MILDQEAHRDAREKMVVSQIEARGIIDPNVLNALRKIPRHLFVPPEFKHQAYGDFPLPIGQGQTISQPYIVAEMTQALKLSRTDRVLEIGTGSGYQAAILSQIVSKVYTLERISKLFEKTRQLFKTLGYINILSKYSDGTTGWEEESPFDAIIVTAGAPQIPQPLIDQLTIGGRLVIPVGDQHFQELIMLEKDEHGGRQTRLGGCRFVKLIGEHGWKEDK